MQKKQKTKEILCEENTFSSLVLPLSSISRSPPFFNLSPRFVRWGEAYLSAGVSPTC
jgi:hypothetical protein